MSSEIEVSETPNWLNELEAKREKRLKTKLGHETGAGAPCLKCGEKCPGLDLHFWRKCCKICRCSKEEHEVQDDDIYGWAEFQLLGNKPSKIKRKIVLPGKNDELELDWAPKGHNDVVDKYLKTLPPEQLPIKGSQAAQDRKQQLQKQIPVHDIDPTLCHELTEDELNKMNEYIAHVKKSSVGVGQIVNLSNIIKGNLHMLNPSDAALIASRYPKGIPLSEIVKLQSMSKVDPLKHHNLSQNMENLNLKDKTMKSFSPNKLLSREETASPIALNKIHDINYGGYTSEKNSSPIHPQYSAGVDKRIYLNDSHDDISMMNNNLNSEKMNKNYQNMGTKNVGKQYSPNPYFNSPKSMSTKTNIDDQYKPYSEPNLHEMIFPNSNFNPKNLPSQFINQHMPYKPSVSDQFIDEKLDETNIPHTDFLKEPPSYTGSAFVPYSKTYTNLKIGNHHSTENPMVLQSYASNLNNTPNQMLRNPYPSNSIQASEWEKATPLAKNSNDLPHYSSSKYNPVSELKSPTQIPKNVKDLAFSTYDPQSLQDPNNFNQSKNRMTNEFEGIRNIPLSPLDKNQRLEQDDFNNVYNSRLSNTEENLNGMKNSQTPNNPYDQETGKNRPQHSNAYNQETGKNTPHFSNAYDQETLKNTPQYSNAYDQGTGKNTPQYSNAYGQETLNNIKNPLFANANYQEASNNMQNPMLSETHQRQSEVGILPLSNFNSPSKQTLNIPHDKKMLNVQPGNLVVPEDFLEPSEVSIGAIQDINYPEIKAAVQGTNDFYEDYSPDSIKEILNNIKLPDCHYCKKPFEEKEFAVTIDRANVLFHAECFKCAGCNQNLADNLYFYSKENNNIYCGRDYAKIRGIPRCKACDELIFTKEYCLAEDNTFHLKHFCCTECDTPLAGQDYVLGDDDGMPYCLPCFERSKADSCSSCDRVIKPDETGCTLNGIHFHADDRCFACKICHKPLLGQKMLLRNNKLYCSHECFKTEQ